MRLNRFTPVALVLGLAVWIGVGQARQLRALRRSAETLAKQVAETRNRTEEARLRLDALRHDLAAQRAERDATSARAALLARDFAVAEPEARWAHPPATLPDWNAESPYVWINKKLLPKFPVQPFGSDGALNAGVARVLAASPEQVAALNQTLNGLITEFRTEEAAHAERTDEHLQGIAEAEGDKVTILVEPMPELGAHLRERFETAVREYLGPQRSELLLETAQGWVQEQFGWTHAPSGGPPPEPRTFSVVRHPDSTFNITIRSGNGWMSVGGPNSLNDYIPAHLRHFFAELGAQPDAP